MSLISQNILSRKGPTRITQSILALHRHPGNPTLGVFLFFTLISTGFFTCLNGDSTKHRPTTSSPLHKVTEHPPGLQIFRKLTSSNMPSLGKTNTAPQLPPFGDLPACLSDHWGNSQHFSRKMESMSELTYEECKEAEISIQVYSLLLLFKQPSKFAARVIKHSWP